MILKAIYNKLFCPYKTAVHKETYKKVAEKYQLDPNRVYRLAHGKRAKKTEEKYALDELVRMGIVKYEWLI